MALPLLFNGLFFSISPSAVHNNIQPGNELAVVEYVQPSQAQTGYCGNFTSRDVVKIEVNFLVDENNRLKVISINCPLPLNSNVMQNISNLMLPQMKSLFATNKTYSITLELKYPANKLS
jgi:hypothetical protein